MEEDATLDHDDVSKEVSDEADQQQLELARKAGNAYQDALEYMINEVAENGDKQEAGDYLIGFAQEEAEGMYALNEGGEDAFEWRVPTDENCHIEVAVCDAEDKRFIPELDITATLSNDDGFETEFEPPFLWHPGLLHYGKNVELPGDGKYDLTVRVEPPTFMRHDEENGNRYGDPVEATFDGIEIETGQDLPDEG